MGIYLKILAFSALMAGLSVAAQPNGAWAQTAQAAGTQIAPQTCDTNVWADMAQRARIETEREIMQNQNLIYKPDSVLTYTCFDSLAAHTAAKAGVLFTHTSYWNPMPLQWGKPYGMDNAVNEVVIKAMKTYIDGNFNHAFLGGRGNVDGLGLGKNEANAQASSGSSYSCGAMGEVWAKAKCINFLHGTQFANNDGYFPFINLKGHNGSKNVDGYEAKKDVRKFPTDCSGSGDPIAGSSWELAYRDARNESNFGNPNKDYQYGQPLDQAFKEVRKRVAPYGSEGATDCAKPIPTGVTVILGPGNTKTDPDGVCTNPGCHYKDKECSATSSGTGGGT